MTKEDATPVALANLTEEIGRDLLVRAKGQYGFPFEHLARIEKALSGQLVDRLTVMRFCCCLPVRSRMRNSGIKFGSGPSAPAGHLERQRSH